MESHSERWRNNVKRMVLAALEDDLYINTCVVQSDADIMFNIRLVSCFENDL